MTDKPELPFGFEEAEDSAGFLLWQVTAVWQRRIAAALRPHGVTHAQFVLMAGLLSLSASEEHVTQIRLAKHSKFDVMTASQVLRALEGKGLLVRRDHPTDSRAKTLHLTPAGRALVMATVPAVEGVDAAFFAVVGGDLRRLNGLLRTLAAATD